jgi:hypothetical protein
MLGTCYVCGTRNVLVEKDHIPPKNLFEAPRPSNLITRPICSRCHDSTHDDDEAFRVFVTGHITRNEAAARLWQQKVVPRTLRGGRIKPFLKSLRESSKPLVIRAEGMDIPTMSFGADRRPIDRVLRRITIGLYSIQAPYIDSRGFTLKIDLVDPFQLSRRMTLAAAMLNHLSRGNGVYDCWWGLDAAKVQHGVWVHMFFRSVAFAVRH